MQVPKDTPDKLAALTGTKPLESVAKRVPKRQLKEIPKTPKPQRQVVGILNKNN
jgi:hypothetical protein